MRAFGPVLPTFACVALLIAHAPGRSSIALAGRANGQSPASGQADALCARGYDFLYNLDFPEALSAFQQAIAAQAKDPVPYRGAATATWLHILYERGVVTVDDYVGHATTGDQQVPPPPAEEAERFRKNLDRALALAEEAGRRNPNSVSAHYDIGSAIGLAATYTATVEGRVIGGLSAARRAYNEQEKVLALDPRRKDAALIVGTYRYIVATLPLPLRVVAYVVGFGGGRERGLQMIEEAAAYAGESQVDAKFALVLLYNRERRFDDALRVEKELQQRFPRNRLLWLEAGATELRAGRGARAEAELSAGIDRLSRDARPRSYGEEALWRYKRGAARVLLRNREGAREDLAASVAAKGRDWVHARAHLELGKLADLDGNHARATTEYQAAVTLAQKDNDPACVDAARALMKTPYRAK